MAQLDSFLHYLSLLLRPESTEPRLPLPAEESSVESSNLLQRPPERHRFLINRHYVPFSNTRKPRYFYQASRTDSFGHSEESVVHTREASLDRISSKGDEDVNQDFDDYVQNDDSDNIPDSNDPNQISNFDGDWKTFFDWSQNSGLKQLETARNLSNDSKKDSVIESLIDNLSHVSNNISNLPGADLNISCENLQSISNEDYEKFSDKSSESPISSNVDDSGQSSLFPQFRFETFHADNDIQSPTKISDSSLLNPNFKIGNVPFIFYRNGIHLSISDTMLNKLQSVLSTLPCVSRTFGLEYTSYVILVQVHDSNQQLLRPNVKEYWNNQPKTFTITKRYSQFLSLFRSLVKQYDIKNWPKFPEKKFGILF